MAVSPMSPMVIGPPLRGSDWVAMNGPANESAHRRSLYGTEGKERSSQRFATDWAKVDGEGQVLSGDPSNNKNYYSYGNQVLDVADGVVREAVDGIPENVPGKSRAVRMGWKRYSETRSCWTLATAATRYTLISKRGACG